MSCLAGNMKAAYTVIFSGQFSKIGFHKAYTKYHEIYAVEKANMVGIYGSNRTPFATP